MKMDIVKFCSENCVERKGTGTLKWDSCKETFGYDDMLPLWIADMEIKSPESARKALAAAVEHGVFGYNLKGTEYFEAFSAWQKKHHGIDMKIENLRYATGVVGSLYVAVQTYTQPGDSVLICSPVYYPFYDAIINSGRNCVTCELDNHDGYYLLDFEKFEKTIVDNEVKEFILCSPHNPVSRVWSEEELDKMFMICRSHGVLVVSDEIHQDFTYDRKFLSSCMVKFGAYRDMLVTLNSGSKTFNLAGLIHSHVVIFDEKLMEKYDAHIKGTGSPETNLMGMAGLAAAFRGGEEWLENVKAVVLHNYNYLTETLARETPKVVVTPLEGTYLSWIDLRAYMPAEKVSEFVWNQCRLACDVGEWFSVNASGFFRMNLATDPKNVMEAVSRIVENLNKAEI
ncbi:MalY/PatB family protein [Acetivibrio ethanolgignens]|nr:PatB family C-S lyase [Acetivibrio ethanolgignens]